MHFQRRRFLSLFLIFTFLLMACSPYVAQVKKPGDTDDKAAWLEYYKDQYKAHGSDVTPPDENASDAEKWGFKEAKHSYVRAKYVSLGISIGVLAIGVGSLLMTLSQL